MSNELAVQTTFPWAAPILVYSKPTDNVWFDKGATNYKNKLSCDGLYCYTDKSGKERHLNCLLDELAE